MTRTTMATMTIVVASLLTRTSLSDPDPRATVLVTPNDGLYAMAPTVFESAVVAESLEEARNVARKLRQSKSTVDVFLLPGVHRLVRTLDLGPEDSGVHWQSTDTLRPAVVSGGTRITGWARHSTRRELFVAPAPKALREAATPIRQLWVNDLRAERPYIYIPGNLTNITAGFDFSRSGLNPSKWANPTHVEFIFHVRWWTQSRCTVASVSGHTVKLKQPCILDVTAYQGQRAPYNQLCDVHGGYPIPGTACGVAYIENVRQNLTRPGQFYYDKAAEQVLYFPRQGETLGSVEASAVTSLLETLLHVNGTQQASWQGVQYSHSTWTVPNTPGGYVESQAGFSQNYNGCNATSTRAACRAFVNGDGCGNTTRYPDSCIARRGREPVGYKI